MTPSGKTLVLVLLSLFLCSSPHGLAGPIGLDSPHPLRQNEAQPTRVIVRVVSHGSMVLGREVGGARITITDVASGEVLATGIQQGEAGDQNQIMRTPRMMDEPQYSTRASASFTTTLGLRKPTLVEITAEGPLAYPTALQKASKTLWLIPGEDLSNDGIVLRLYGYLVQIEQPKPGKPLIAKDDVTLRVSIRTLSGSLVRPHGDWDSRKIHMYGEIMIGNRAIERLQLFYDEGSRTFQAPFFVPLPQDAPDGITLRVIAADPAGGNFGIGQEPFAVLNERPPSRNH